MNKINNHKIWYCELPNCEHCGEGYAVFGIEIDHNGIDRCLDCYKSSEKVEDWQEKQIRTTALKEELGWHQKQIWKLEKKLKELL